MKKFIIVLLIISGSLGYFYLQESETILVEEDISSYDITNRHECYQIQDNQKYNDCISFYLLNTPYRENEKLVATRLVE